MCNYKLEFASIKLIYLIKYESHKEFLVILSIKLPHKFPSLLSGEKRPVVLIGAGMSYGIVPNPNELLESICREAQEQLNCESVHLPQESLYSWADEVLNCLKEQGHPTPKLDLAKSLKLLSNKMWAGTITIRPLMTHPRHRVLARFSREGRIRSLWSLNWDTHLESVMQCIGIREKRTNSASNSLPWCCSYRSFITDKDFKVLDDSFIIYKPHGCVAALEEANNALQSGNTQRANELSERFLIGKAELESRTNSGNDTAFKSFLNTQFPGRALYGLGWSASEPYLLDYLDEIRNQLQSEHDDSLTIIDLAFNDKGHSRLAVIYDTSKEKAHVNIDSNLCIDDLLLWLQARYVIAETIKQCNNTSLKTKLSQINEAISEPNPSSQKLLIDWADCFLPSWLRLCWRASLVKYIHNGQVIQSHDIRLEAPDEHIPMNIGGIVRIDILASIPLLLKLNENPENYDLRTYPGGIYRKKDSTLIIPLPAWQTDYHDLKAINPLLESITHSRGFGLISAICILPLIENESELSHEAGAILSQKLASKMGSLAFSTSDRISVLSLDAIAGGEDERE